MNHAITRKQLQKLHQFLEQHNHEAHMSLGYVHGFITAIVSAPELILPSNWLEHLDFNFESKQQMQTIIPIIMKMYNATINSLDKKCFQPILNDTKKISDDLEQAALWTRGYLEAASHFGNCVPFGDSDDMTAELVHPIASLALSNELLQEMIEEGGETLDVTLHELKLSYLQQLPDVVSLIYWHWRDMAIDDNEADTLPTHNKFKIGRNAPYPCDSDLKYKKCCLQEPQHVVH